MKAGYWRNGGGARAGMKKAAAAAWRNLMAKKSAAHRKYIKENVERERNINRRKYNQRNGIWRICNKRQISAAMASNVGVMAARKSIWL
jgi:hypothetical protein